MAGEHDFAPLSDASVESFCAQYYNPAYCRMAREIRASRAAMRALVEAESDMLTAIVLAQLPSESEWMQQYRKLRALVAHVGPASGEGEGR